MSLIYSMLRMHWRMACIWISIAPAEVHSQSKDTITHRDSTTLPRISLNEVVIKGRKPPVRFELDRQVFRAAEFATARNGNAVDLVRNLPSVTLDGQGSLQLRGTSSFLVMINGKPAQGDPAFILSQIPASQIDRIEVISTPGAAYDADGRGGILHITTLSAPEPGWVVQANLMQGAPSVQDFDNTRYRHPIRNAADLLLSWRNPSWEISAGMNRQRNDMAGYRLGEGTTRLPGRETAFPSEGERSFRRRTTGTRLAMAWEPHAKHRLEAAFYLGSRYQSRVADLQYQNQQRLPSGAVRRLGYFNENTQDKEGRFTLASLGSTHTIGTTSTLLLSAQYEGARLTGMTLNRNLASKGSTTDYQTTQNPSNNPLHAYRMKADWSTRKQSWTWQGGYQFRYDDQQGDFSYSYRNLGQTSLQLDPAFSGCLHVSNRIHAAYLQVSRPKGTIRWQAGLRTEFLHRSLSSSLAAPEQLKMWNLFPSGLVRYPVTERSTIKASYARRVKRSNNFELNPIPEREHSETLEQGDPRLLPELTGTWEAGWEKKLTKGSLSLSGYHQRILNPIQRVNGVYNDSILNRVYTNAQRALQTGLEGSLSYRLGKAWQALIGWNLYRYQIQGEILQKPEWLQNSSWIMSLNMTQTFTMRNNWSLQGSLNWLTRRATLQGTDGPFISPNLTLRKTTRDGRWTFVGQWLFMDAGLGISNRQRISTVGADFHTSTLYIYEPDQIQLTASFQLKKKNRQIALPQSEMAEKEF